MSSSKTPASGEASNGTITFIDFCRPPLEAGDYRLSMSQNVSAHADDKVPWNAHPYRSEHAFSVEAPRFGLDASDIHSLYPPADQQGAYTRTLPNVALTRRTLPWERPLDAEHPADTERPAPWMALLLLHAQELSAAVIAPLAILAEDQDSLLSPSANSVVQAPDLGQADDQQRQRLQERHAGERCLCVDIPAGTFAAAAPREQDLPWLCHVRRVDTDNKEIYRHQDAGHFALVLGHRLPAEGDNLALLVSLEGHRRHLPGGEHPTPQDGRVRLAVLGHWRFGCRGSLDFKGRLKALDPFADDPETPADAWLRLPSSLFDSEPDPDDPDAVVNAAFARGYAAFDHRLRHGERTLSWYRGPLVPLVLPCPRQTRQLPVNGDSLLSLDPEQGMLDVSRATAWQLGRCLALQNHGFAQGLERTRSRLRQQALVHWRRDDLQRRLSSLGLAHRHVLADSLLERLSRPQDAPPALPARDGTPSAGPAPSVKALPEADIRAALNEISGWLGRLVLLYGLSLHHLVPERDMLPAESLRTFFVDPGWIQALIQGALSLGNTRYGVSLIDQVMNAWVTPGDDTDQAGQAATRVRATLRAECAGHGTAKKPADDRARLHWPITGFLLCSQVVEGWRGLEIEAFDANDQRLAPLRLEQLGDDVLLGIFNGRLVRLALRQPGESLHFGVSGDAGGMSKTLRNTSGEILTGVNIAIPVRGAHTLEIAHLAELMADRLRREHQLDDAAHWGSGAFAMQMIDAPGEFTFTVAPPTASQEPSP